MSADFSNFSGWPYYVLWLCGNILKRAIFGVFWALSTDFSIATGSHNNATTKGDRMSHTPILSTT
ncbi:hypothetical protein L873DRAFT_1816414 [Choiromyces venosus 120613-1]|uniref:Uncharacterized protein n=1 Tax=Choiromyces venosus 120613-1 TaxID=1336337 RepID=A0A3N4J9N5_9PEZI|nr:hypothetical protein L873DRAFT_1816414 [Choiromyces venosus 120613-1]